MTDAELEDAITTSSLQFIAAKTPSERRKIWNAHKKLLEQRSEQKVREMEEKIFGGES